MVLKHHLQPLLKKLQGKVVQLELDYGDRSKTLKGMIICVKNNILMFRDEKKSNVCLTALSNIAIVSWEKNLSGVIPTTNRDSHPFSHWLITLIGKFIWIRLKQGYEMHGKVISSYGDVCFFENKDRNKFFAVFVKDIIEIESEDLIAKSEVEIKEIL